MRRYLFMLIAVLMVTAVGCQKKEEAAKAAPAAPVAASQPSPQGGPVAAAMQPATPQGPANPHAGLSQRDIPAGTGHKGKVIETLDAGPYTYLQVEENGKKVWVAAMKAAVKKGDTVEFPNSQPMVNFESKKLKRTFAEVYFADTLKVTK